MANANSLGAALGVAIFVLSGTCTFAQEPFPPAPDPVNLLAEEPPEDDLAERLQALEEAWTAHLEELDADKEEAEKKAAEAKEKPKAWYEKIGLRGYTQLRYNQTLSMDPGSAPAQHNGDGSVGDNQSFLIRRARLVFSGDIGDHVALYFQPDFASSVPGSPDSNQFAQIRDLYADIYIDENKEFRFRVGQSKVPYGWENLQSSQNRLPLDRNDALNSAVRNERDLGVFFYWTPQEAQDIFKWVMDEGLKGSGNYGVLGIGAYNGQGGSFREQNDDVHVIARLTLPYQFCNCQVMEFGVQGYMGEYTVLSSPISPLGVGAAVRPLGTSDTGNPDGIIDRRIAATFVYYPQPWGFQSEWTVGKGPGLNDAQTEVIARDLHGGYVMTMYRLQTEDCGDLFPFVRWNYYEGGYKSERNAPYSKIDELECGLEWQFSKYLELVGMYTVTDRTNTTARGAANTLSYNQFSGDLLRFQLQFNY